ncbi:hypothetical protein AZKH_3358 [Azoarcus sp. KH32C]|nr:hypothetical protein AZKH_3358 [Azoarcus sp. KH32C]
MLVVAELPEVAPRDPFDGVLWHGGVGERRNERPQRNVGDTQDQQREPGTVQFPALAVVENSWRGFSGPATAI